MTNMPLEMDMADAAWTADTMVQHIRTFRLE